VCSGEEIGNYFVQHSHPDPQALDASSHLSMVCFIQGPLSSEQQT